MNKKTIITALLAFVAMAGQGQEIKRVTASPENFMEHMALYGYEVFTYDIASLRDSVSGFNLVIREYNLTGMINEEEASHFRTRMMISDFSEEDQKEIYDTKDADDLERGIFRLSKTLYILSRQIYPSYFILFILVGQWSLSLLWRYRADRGKGKDQQLL